jgi:phosphoglycerate dehydrogenase-like enzyme
MRIAVLDDYQQVALSIVDWSSLSAATEIMAFRDHFKTVAHLETKLKGFNVIIAMRERTPFPRQLLAQLTDLRLLVTTGMRNASIDLTAATELGIPVCGTRGGGPATAELAWGIILSLIRNIPQEFIAVREGKWQTTLGVELQGKTLGLLGLGNLGSHMAVIGKAFGMSVIAWSQNLTPEKAVRSCARLVSKDELFASSDILSVHLQLSDRTRGLVGTQALALMKPSAYFINTSRGPIVDRAALIRALQTRAIAGVGLDVYDEEPLPADDPLRKLDKVVLTPHLGFVTRETYTAFYRDAVEDIQAYINNQPIRLLNPDVLGRMRSLL